jgi:hypothetical protein
VAEYEHGWVADIEQEYGPKGLSEDTVRFISAKKDEPEWMLEWRLKAYRLWQTMPMPDWAKLNIPPIDYQEAYYWAAPKKKDGPKSLDEVDPEILRVYEKLGIPLAEQEVLAGVEGAQDGGRGVRQRFGGHHLPQGTGSRGRDLPLDQRGDPRISRSGPPLAGQGRADARQLLSPRSTARSFPTAPSSTFPRACAARWSCPPISASTRKTPASSSAP